MNPFTSKWPWFLSGGLLALLLVAAVFLFGEPADPDNAVRTAAAYFDESVEERAPASLPELDWQLALLLGLFIGAGAAAAVSGEITMEAIPEDFSGSGPSRFLKTAGCGLAGGFLLLCGCRIAGFSPLGAMTAGFRLSVGAGIFLAVLLATAALLSILLAAGGGGASAKSAGGKPAQRKAPAKRRAAR
ncbi:MAG: YeeE/YedE thiosulfate transporter family protein [Victivallaceae bacterium]|nr:YeeE/YedE thiosulfate transporter family protein [Victivallaceae bacterium]